MVNYVINSKSSLLNFIGNLQQQSFNQLNSLAIDGDASFLSQNINDWGPLLSALTLSAASQNIKSLEVSNVSPDASALVVPHIAKLVQRFPKIQRFTLRSCPLGMKTAQFVGECLNSHPSLKRVVVEHCDLRSEGALMFVSSLLKVENYRDLVTTSYGAGDSHYRQQHQSASSPLELIDIGHNEIRLSSCKEIADLGKICVTQSSFFSNLQRIEFRGNNFVLSAEELEGEGDQETVALLKKMFSTRKDKQQMECLMAVQNSSNNRGAAGGINNNNGQPPLSELPVGENLKFMTSADQETGFVFPALNYLKNQVHEDLSAVTVSMS